MKRILTLMAIVVGMILSYPVSAQQGPLDAASFLRQSLSRQSGHSLIQDVRLTGTVESIAGSDDETVPFTFLGNASGSSRLEVNLSDGRLTEIRQVSPSGLNATSSGKEGEPHVPAGHNLMTDTAWNFPYLVLRRMLQDKNVVTSCGETEEGFIRIVSYTQPPSGLTTEAGAQLQHISQQEMDLDPTTFLPIRFKFNIHPDNNALLDIPVTVLFLDYRSIGGAMIPMHVAKFVNETLSLDFHVQQATLNSGLTEADFSSR